MRNELEIRGFRILKSHLDRAAQQGLVTALRPVLKVAPLFSPDTPYGRVMSVRMTSAGRLGWYSDRTGYRYVARHPNGAPWPNIPPEVLDIWHQATGLERKPDCCLINFYGAEAKLALHQDRDEGDFSWPVVSISLGDDGLFRIGGTTRGNKTESIWLNSGDVVVMGLAARLAYHGVDRIRFGSSTLLPRGGRINLTMRVVNFA
jgi:alkylated DNA repair protein (DNA oxidative demethylase)